jgi:predicted transcriptional regulator
VSDETDAIISIHPSYADAILAGEKTIELRRRVPNLSAGTRLWIYATRPTAAVIGVATIRNVARAHPTTLWKRHRNGTGVDHASFRAYFNGAQQGVAIVLAAARRVGPITIEQLRSIRHGFHPPQVLTVLSEGEAKALRKLLHTKQIMRKGSDVVIGKRRANPGRRTLA